MGRSYRIFKKNNHHNYKLQKAWDMYGESNFVFSVLEKVENNDDLFKIEEKYIKKFKFYNLFNIMKKPGQKPRKKNYWTKKNEKDRKQKKEKEEYDWGID